MSLFSHYKKTDLLSEQVKQCFHIRQQTQLLAWRQGLKWCVGIFAWVWSFMILSIDASILKGSQVVRESCSFQICVYYAGVWEWITAMSRKHVPACLYHSINWRSSPQEQNQNRPSVFMLLWPWLSRLKSTLFGVKPLVPFCCCRHNSVEWRSCLLCRLILVWRKLWQEPNGALH